MLFTLNLEVEVVTAPDLLVQEHSPPSELLLVTTLELVELKMLLLFPLIPPEEAVVEEVEDSEPLCKK